MTLADLPDAPKNDPPTTKVHQMLAGKLLQCEPGVVNIVAYGTPLPMNDRDVDAAVLGVEMVMFANGHGYLHRDSKAPFVPAARLSSDDDRREFVDPFRKMSAVWQIRLGPYARSRFLLNPNAALTIPADLVTTLSDPPAAEGDGSSGGGGAVTSGGDREPSEDCVDPDEEVSWTEMAEDFVNACGSLEVAKRELETLAASALPIGELQSRLDQVWAGQPGERTKVRFVSPSNAELATQFVVDCGGYELATACLIAYAEEQSQDPIEPEA